VVATNQDHPSLAGYAHLRQIPEVGTRCVSCARQDLCGGSPCNGSPYRSETVSCSFYIKQLSL
jgi:hypothetical protein